MNMLFAPCIVAGLLFLALYLRVHIIKNRPRKPLGTYVGRLRTADISILGNSTNGFIGRATRNTPLPAIVAMLNDATNPVASYGLIGLATSSNTVRSLLSTDSAVASLTGKNSGIATGNFPFQQQSATNYGATTIGGLTAAPSGPIDVMKRGFINVYVNTAQAGSVSQADSVYAWIAASTGAHVQGGFENAAAASVASAPGANTGNGTLGTLSVAAASALNGAYTVKFTAATVFSVFDPNGRELLNGATGAAYTDAGVTFTITAGGTAFVAGDTFTVTVTMQTVSVPSAYFVGPGDASTGCVELAFNL